VPPAGGPGSADCLEGMPDIRFAARSDGGWDVRGVEDLGDGYRVLEATVSPDGTVADGPEDSSLLRWLSERLARGERPVPMPRDKG